jgi:hypothetical protein
MFVFKNYDYSALVALFLVLIGIGLIYFGSDPLAVFGAVLLVCAVLVPFARLKSRPPTDRRSGSTGQPSK